MHIDIGHGITIHASITNEAIDDLALAVGDEGDGRDQGVRRHGREMNLCARATTLALVALSGPTLAQAAGSLALTGHIAHPRTLSSADLAALPHVAADLPAIHGGAVAHVSGVLLWPLLDQAGLIDQPGQKTREQHVILARGRDGYAVALSIGELDPSLEGKAVLVITDRESKPVPNLDLYVPGDHRARPASARSGWHRGAITIRSSLLLSRKKAFYLERSKRLLLIALVIRLTRFGAKGPG